VDTAWLSDVPLATAQIADLMAWSDGGPVGSRLDALYIRNAAIRLALREGVREEEIAEALRIRPSDVGRIAAVKAAAAY
jgi:hypothetical protein